MRLVHLARVYLVFSLIEDPTMAAPLRHLTLSLLRSKLSVIRCFSSSPNPTDRVSAIADDITKLTILETSDLVELLRQKLGVEQMPTLTAISPGMAVFGGGGGAAGSAAEAEVKEEVKEKTAFDVKLEGFDAAAKIKVIKEVRGFTALGLKEAKELVEKVPVVVKAGATKEEAEKIVGKLKEIGAKVVME